MKFPTESLKLTLWEERYKALSRYVLDNPVSLNENTKLPMFGAMYCSHKTQIVPKGTLPITPLIEEGDIGTLCGVSSSEVYIDGQEVALERKDDENVQKIRLWGQGLTRFQVKRVISDGLNGRLDDENSSSLPFLIVEATCIDDSHVYEELDEEEMFMIDDRIKTLASRRKEYELFRDSNVDIYSYTFMKGNEHLQKQQMSTFSLVSNLEATAPAEEMLQMLRTTSISERLDYLEKKLPKSTWFENVNYAFRVFME